MNAIIIAAWTVLAAMPLPMPLAWVVVRYSNDVVTVQRGHAWGRHEVD